MKKFTIFNKLDKFHWTKNRIIYSILSICLLLVFISNGPGIIKKTVFNNIIMVIFFITLFTGLIIKFLGFAQYEPLNGELDGSLIFEMDSIEICDEKFDLNKIKSIEIANNDYLGKMTGTSRGNFNGALSNGVKNHIKIILYSGEIIWCNYQLINSNDFREIKEELINYYKKGKIEFDNLANVLGETGYKENIQFQAELQKDKHNR